MLRVRQRLNVSSPGTASPAAERLVLPFELRQKSRLRARLASGLEVGLFLERGIVLRGGDLLLADDGTVIEVVAALETVSTVRDADATRLARAGYHLGNRHVPVEIGAGWLRYGHDHVLDDMVRGMGLNVVIEQAPFEPEAGAYGHSHSHGDGHEHAHEHGSEHQHLDSHAHDAGLNHSRDHGRDHGGLGHDHAPGRDPAPGYEHAPGHDHAPGHGFGVLIDHKHDDHRH